MEVKSEPSRLSATPARTGLRSVGHAREEAFGVEQRLALEAPFPEPAPATIFPVGCLLQY